MIGLLEEAKTALYNLEFMPSDKNELDCKYEIISNRWISQAACDFAQILAGNKNNSLLKEYVKKNESVQEELLLVEQLANGLEKHRGSLEDMDTDLLTEDLKLQYVIDKQGEKWNDFFRHFMKKSAHPATQHGKDRLKIARLIRNAIGRSIGLKDDYYRGLEAVDWIRDPVQNAEILKSAKVTEKDAYKKCQKIDCGPPVFSSLIKNL